MMAIRIKQVVVLLDGKGHALILASAPYGWRETSDGQVVGAWWWFPALGWCYNYPKNEIKRLAKDNHLQIFNTKEEAQEYFGKTKYSVAEIQALLAGT